MDTPSSPLPHLTHLGDINGHPLAVANICRGDQSAVTVPSNKGLLGACSPAITTYCRLTNYVVLDGNFCWKLMKSLRYNDIITEIYLDYSRIMQWTIDDT
jgi:hypothetical protein